MSTISIYYFDISKKSSNPLNNGDAAVLKNTQAIIESVYNLLASDKNTKLWNPDYGLSLDTYLFDFVDNVTAIQLQHDIETGIGVYEPRLSNVVVTVTPDADNQTFWIDIVGTETLTNTVITISQIDFVKLR
jgi:phage baseplate assembly protein W